MSSSSSAAVPIAGWTPSLDLTSSGLSRFDPARVQQAVDDGWAAGFEAGRAEAAARVQEALDAELAAVRARAHAVLQQLEAAVAALADAERAAAAAFASGAATAAIALAEGILGRALADEVLAATAAAERALGALDHPDEAVLRLHPDDVALLDARDLGPGIRLVGDGSLAPGDAVAEAGDRRVDARIGAALARAQTVLAGTEELSA